MSLCIIINCEEELSRKSKLQICPLCRQTLYRWSHRRPAEVLQRRSNLEKYSDRMENVKIKGARK